MKPREAGQGVQEKHEPCSLSPGRDSQLGPSSPCEGGKVPQLLRTSV